MEDEGWLGEGKRELFGVMAMLYTWLWWWLQEQAFVRLTVSYT